MLGAERRGGIENTSLISLTSEDGRVRPRPFADLHDTSEYVVLLGKERLDPVDNCADAG